MATDLMLESLADSASHAETARLGTSGSTELSAGGPLVEVRIEAVEHVPHLAWADHMRVSLPIRLVTETELFQGLEADGSLVMPAHLPAVSTDEAQQLRLRAAFTDRPPLSARWPVSYRRIPASIRCLLASAIGRFKRRTSSRWAEFPRYPVDLSADFLADLARGRPSPLAAGPTPVVLTHDIDSPEGLRNLLTWFLDLEECVGARSTCFIVPCDWPIDHGVLEHLRSRGNEIGVHGHDHSGRTPFVDDASQRRRLARAVGAVERYGAVGYRAPSLYRTRGLLRNLADFCLYDSSIPTSGGPFPAPNSGCATARPFSVEGLAELPLTMPRDGSLRFLGYSADEILKIWIHCAEAISRSGGVVVLLTHCESRFSGNAPMYRAYRQFLDFVSESGRFAFRSAREVIEQSWQERVPGRPGPGGPTSAAPAEEPALAAV